MAMRRSHNLHTIYIRWKCLNTFPPEMGVDLTCANTIIYEMSKLCMAINIPILLYFFLKLCSYTNFGMLFPTVAIDFCFFTYI